MHLAGPEMLRLVFHIFVVIVGVLILSGAVNTSIIGANGVMNRVAEDGVLLDWFRKPHKRFGTTYRIINLITLLQVTTIVAQPRRRLPAGRGLRVRRGVELLPEIAGRAGAALPAARPGIQIPVQHPDARRGDSGRAGRYHADSGFVAIANLFSKQIATIYGVAFTMVVFIIFTISEHVNARKRQLQHLEKKPLEEFNLDISRKSHAERCMRGPGCVLVAVRDYTTWSTCRRCSRRPTCGGTTSW